jgi:hypothetical protein
MPAEDCPHARRSEPNAHRGQLPVDSAIYPGRVLSRHTKDQRDRPRWNRRSSRPPVRVGPLPSHEFSMPTKESLRLDKEATPASNRQQPAQSSKHRPIRWLQGRTGHLPAQDGNLVAEHDDLDGQLFLSIARETDQLKYADEGNVEEGERHAPSSSPGSRQRKSRSTIRMTFSTPTRLDIHAHNVRVNGPAANPGTMWCKCGARRSRRPYERWFICYSDALSWD